MLATASADAVRAEEPGWSALGRKRTRRRQATRPRVLEPALDRERTLARGPRLPLGPVTLAC